MKFLSCLSLTVSENPWYPFYAALKTLNIPLEIFQVNLNGVFESHVFLLLSGKRSTLLLGDPSCILVTPAYRDTKWNTF